MGSIRVYRDNELRTQFELSEERVTIGRTEDNTIVLPDPSISKQHAEIVFEDGNYFVIDLGSSNGVFLNNERIEKAKLKYWDEIQIHNFVIKFMAKQGAREKIVEEDQSLIDLESDKTEFFDFADQKQLDSLKHKTKQCFVTYTERSGALRKQIIKKPRTIIGRSKDADVRIGGWFAPSVAATIERRGNAYELVPGNRGNVIFQGQLISEPTKLIDDSKFIVRDIPFRFINRVI